MSPLIIVIVTFGLLFVTFAALANGLNLNISATVASLKGRALPTVGVLIANFVVVPLLIGLTLYASISLRRRRWHSRCSLLLLAHRSSLRSPESPMAMRPSLQPYP